MTLFLSAFELFRRCFFKHKVDDAEKLGTVLQDRDENTKLEIITGTAAELEGGKDIDTQLQSHASQRLSWTSIMCRIGLVKCEDCTGHRASTLKRDEHQDQATSEVIVWVAPGQCIEVEILVHVPAPAPYQDEINDMILLSLLGIPNPLHLLSGVDMTIDTRGYIVKSRVYNECLLRGEIKIESFSGRACLKPASGKCNYW